MNRFWHYSVVFGLVMLVGCVEQPDTVVDEEEPISTLKAAQRETRSLIIANVAADEGLSNGVLLAGIANAETGMAHCWSEATWACQGPASSSCNGGPVIAGSGDGPCRNLQGGLGMFQFDAGTHAQTLARYSSSVLTLEGNVRHGIDFVTDMVIRSRYISNVSTRAQALAWLNEVRVDGFRWDAWIKTVTHYYNGCVPGRCSVYNQRYNSYSSKSRAVFLEFGEEFWYGERTPPEPPTTPVDLAPNNGQVSNNASIALSWSSVDGASSYDVDMEFLDAASNQWRTYFTWTNRSSNTFTVWPQIPDVNYRWRVRACTGGACSDWSSRLSFAAGNAVVVEPEPVEPEPEPVEPEPEPVEPEPEPVEPEPEPGSAVPSELSPNGITTSSASVVLQWDRIADADAYDVSMEYQSTNGTWNAYFTWTGIRNNTFTVWPQTANVHYRWKVLSCNGDGCSSWSSPAIFGFGNPRTPGTGEPLQSRAPSTPGSVSPSGGTVATASTDLTWSSVSGANTYDVHMEYRFRNGNWTDYYTWSNQRGTRFTVWPQIDNVTYRWSVRACNADGCSDYTSPESFFFTGR